MDDIDASEREKAGQLMSAVREAKKALADHPYRAMHDYDYEPLRCAATGVVLIEGDEIVQDSETGEMWLRSALGLPPRAEVLDEDEDDDESAYETEDATA